MQLAYTFKKNGVKYDKGHVFQFDVECSPAVVQKLKDDLTVEDAHLRNMVLRAKDDRPVVKPPSTKPRQLPGSFYKR